MPNRANPHSQLAPGDAGVGCGLAGVPGTVAGGSDLGGAQDRDAPVQRPAPTPLPICTANETGACTPTSQTRSGCVYREGTKGTGWLHGVSAALAPGCGRVLKDQVRRSGRGNPARGHPSFYAWLAG